MSTPLNIFQYQSVVFNDTTTGAGPFTLNWSFPGGTPSTGASGTQSVLYNVPGDYTVSLTATDIYGTTKTLIESNLIHVDPTTLIAGITGPVPSTVKMNSSYTVYDASVANPYPATSWLWTLPEGQTAGTQNVTVSGYGDWYTLTGTYSGAPGSSYTGTIYLTSGNGFSLSSASTTIDIQKLGRSEILYTGTTGGPVSPYTVTGFSGSLPLTTTPPGNTPINTTEFGYVDNYYIAKMDYRLRGLTNRTNQYFHSTNEAASTIVTSGLWDSTAFLDTIGGFLVINGAIYSNYSSLAVPGPEINLGNYVTGGQVSEFFIADETGLLEDLYENRNYSVQLINYLLSSPYKNLNSGNLQYLNANPPGPISQMTFIDPTNSGASGSNPLVYSSFYLNSLGSTTPNPVYQVTITATIGGTPYGATASFGAAGSTGNFGDFYVAQDTPNGVGIASILNGAINLSIPGGTGTLIFAASQIFNCDYASPTGASYDPSTYYGLDLYFPNSLNYPVVQVNISDNSSSIGFTPALTYPIAPFTADFGNSQGSYQTCSGLNPNQVIITVPLTPPFGSMNFGGTIAYP